MTVIKENLKRIWDCLVTKAPEITSLLQGGYSSVSEYFRELVRHDQKRQAAERLETMLLEGLNSGNPTEMTPDDWEDIRQAVQERIAKHKGSNQD